MSSSDTATPVSYRLASRTAFTLRPVSGAGATDEIDDRLIVYQRLALPVQADEGKQSVLDLVPFAGSGRIVADRNRHTSLIAQRLELQFPRAGPTSVASSAVRADE